MFYGIGITGLPNPGFCRIETHDSGDFTLYLGCGDMGQGSATTMTQIAAEVLRSVPEKIHLMIGDTDLCPDSGTSTASRVTYVVGRSVQLASENLRELLRGSAATVFGIAKEEVILDKGFLYPSETPGLRIPVSEVVKKLKEEGISPVGEGTFNPETTPLDVKTGQGNPYGTYAFAAQGALVSVDTGTGEVEVLDIVASHDVGRAVNPTNVVAQIEGGVSMGLGYGLMEEVVLKDGTIRNPRFSEYFIPTALDVPEVTSMLVESEEPSGPFGAKGVGEPALLPTAPAILNAIAAATGVRPKEIPVTSESLWRLLRERY
jgi:CO/xanthine dehydrogenase Mo-binding subunit